MRAVFVIPLAGFLILGLIAAVGLYTHLSGSRQPDQLPSMLIGKAAPDRPLAGLDGSPPRPLLSNQENRFQLVNFFASWCAPCRAEAPALMSLSSRLSIIGIAYKDKPADTIRFLEQFGNPYQIIGLDPDGQAGLDWGIYGVPESFLLDPAGKVLFRHAGPIDRAVMDRIGDLLEQAK